MALDAEVYSYVSRELQVPLLKAAGRFAAGLEVGDQLASFCILFIMAGYLWQKPRVARAFTGGLFALAAGGIAVQALKHLIGRARPARALGDLYFIGPHFTPSGFDSFPSGHTTALFALLAFLCRYYPGWTVPLYAAAFMLALLGRVITGQHFFTDVVGGAILGSAVGLLVARQFGRAVEPATSESSPVSARAEIPARAPGPRPPGSGVFKDVALAAAFSAAALLIGPRPELFSDAAAILFGILTAVCGYFLARELCGHDSALYAALILASALLFVGVARLLPADAAWLFLTTLAFLSYVYSTRGRSTSNMLLVMAYAAIGLAFFLKGPLALFPAVVFFLHEHLEANQTAGSTARSALRHGALLACTLLVFGLWLGRGAASLPQESAFFFDAVAARAGLTRRAGKVIYYLPLLALAFFPWTFFAISYFVKEGKRWLRDTKIGSDSRLLLAWTILIVAVVPFAAAEAPHYIVLALPPTACLLGPFVKHDRGRRFSLAATTFLAAGLGITAAVFYLVRPQHFSLKFAAPFAVLTLSFAAAWISEKRNYSAAMFASICLGALGFYACAYLIAL